MAVELKYAICLSSLGYEDKCQEILTITLPKIVLDDAQKKKLMINLERISNRDADIANGSNSSAAKAQKSAFVVGEILPNEAWIKIARE